MFSLPEKLLHFEINQVKLGIQSKYFNISGVFEITVFEIPGVFFISFIQKKQSGLAVDFDISGVFEISHVPPIFTFVLPRPEMSHCHWFNKRHDCQI